MSLKTAEEVIQSFEKLENNSHYFRGYTDYNIHMRPSLGRGDYNENEFKILHSYYIKNKELIEFKSFIDVIEHAQHYGEKTRLLDWSLSPWVALYFANYNNKENNKTTYIGMINTNISSFKKIPILPITTKMIGDFTGEDIGKFTWEDMAKFGIESTDRYLSNIKFERFYKKFLQNMTEGKYLINRYSIKEMNLRKKSQKGLFTFHKDPKSSMELKDFYSYELELPKEEKVKLLDILSEKYGVNRNTLGFDTN